MASEVRRLGRKTCQRCRRSLAEGALSSATVEVSTRWGTDSSGQFRSRPVQPYEAPVPYHERCWLEEVAELAEHQVRHWLEEIDRFADVPGSAERFADRLAEAEAARDAARAALG